MLTKLPLNHARHRDEGHGECVHMWTEVWEQARQHMSLISWSGDVIGGLEVFQGHLRSEYSSDDTPCPAIAEAIDQGVVDLIKTLRASVADHFLGPPPVQEPAD